MIRPSPNEILRFSKEENILRRQTRLQQVREQEKIIAQNIRNRVRQKQQIEIAKLVKTLEAEWIQKQRETIAETEMRYTEGLQQVGLSHYHAEENAPNQALRDAEIQKQQSIAFKREKIALANEKILKEKQNEKTTRKLHCMKVAQSREKIRAKYIANLPAKGNDIDAFFTNKSQTFSSNSSKSETGGMYSTTGVNSNVTINTGLRDSAGVVEKVEVHIDAREDAKTEEERINLLQAERERSIQERLAKAKVRHEVALQKARLNTVGAKCLQELKTLQKKDALRRQNNIYKTEPFPRRQYDIKLWNNSNDFSDSMLFGTRQKFHEETESDSSNIDESTEIMLMKPESTAPLPQKSNAMNKLLKQIELQKVQKTETLNDVSLSTISENSQGENIASSTEVDNKTESAASDITPVFYDNTDDSEAPREPNIEDKEITNENNSAQSSSTASNGLDFATKFEGTLKSLKSDEELQRSVEEFQRKLLQQQSSQKTIKDQIRVLEAKKNKINSMIHDLGKVPDHSS